MRRILLIDGSPRLLQALRNALEYEGYETIIETFVQIEDTNRIIPLKPNLIILDIVTGIGQNIGWKILKKLKQSPDTESIPVIITTADLKEVKQWQDFLTSHAIQVILKPFPVRALLEKVRIVMNRRI